MKNNNAEQRKNVNVWIAIQSITGVVLNSAFLSNI